MGDVVDKKRVLISQTIEENDQAICGWCDFKEWKCPKARTGSMYKM